VTDCCGGDGHQFIDDCWAGGWFPSWLRIKEVGFMSADFNILPARVLIEQQLYR
jgi:hypothetical protein